MPLHRATISGVYLGQTIQNVFHFQSGAGSGATNLQLATDVSSFVIPKMQLLLHNNFRFVQVQAIEIRNPAPMAASLVPNTLPGTGSTGEAHLPASFKLRWLTARGGRRGFGKTYFGGISWSLTQGGNQLTSTGTTRMNDVGNLMQQRYMGPSKVTLFQMVLVHKDTSDPPNDIINWSIYPVIGTQRRRNLLVGI